MKRRDLLVGLGGGVVLAGGIGSAVFLFGGNSQQTKTEITDPPERVETAKPLAKDFYKRIVRHYETARVFVTRRGHIVLDFNPNAESQTALRKEFNRIANLFADVVGEGHPPRSLTMVAENLQAIVPEPTVTAYTAGKIEQDAYFKTIHIDSIERQE